MVQYDLGLDPNSDTKGLSQRDVPEEEEQEQDDSNRRSNNEGDDDLSLDEFLPRSSSLKMKTSIYEDAEVIDEDEDHSHLSKYEAMEAHLRKSLMKEQEHMVDKKLHEEIDSMRNEPTDIHMLAVYYLVKCKDKSLWKSKAAILTVMLSFLVVGIQIMISAYLVNNIITPTCIQDDDCPQGNFCVFDYDIYGDRMSQHGNCYGECYVHNKFGQLYFPGPEWTTLIQEAGCEDENDTHCIENISQHQLRNFCDNLETPYTRMKDLCFRSVYCKDPDWRIDEKYCDFVKGNREVLDFMGTFILVVVGILIALNINEDIRTARKQLTFLQHNAPPSILKQISSTVIIASSTCLPFCAVQATVMLMLGSPMLPQNIVLNALSIAFILEIDNVVGKFVLKAMQIEEDSIREKFDYNKVRSKTVHTIMDYIIICTCFVLFIYQIWSVDKEFRLIIWLFLSMLGEPYYLFDLTCTELALYFYATVGIVPGIICIGKVFIAIFESCRFRSTKKIWYTFLWEVLTIFSALFLYIFFTWCPWVLKAIFESSRYGIYSSDIDINAADINIGIRSFAKGIAIVFGSVTAILGVLLWQLEKRLIHTSDVITNFNEDIISSNDEEFFNENQYPLPKRHRIGAWMLNLTTNQKIYAFAVVVSLSLIVGMLGGLLPRMRNASCQFTKVENCPEFKEKHRNCEVEKPFLIGDGKCNGREYNTVECNYDNGDCWEFNAKYPNCTVEYPFMIGDGYCQGDEFNTKNCNWDGGDCLELNTKYPNCKISFDSWLGEGWCNEYSGNNIPQCGWDFGNCAPPEIYLCMMNEDRIWYDEKCFDFVEVYPNCNVDEPGRIGDGTCDEGEYNTEECNFDGGDCDFSNGFICLQEDALTWEESRAIALEMNADLVKIECEEQTLKVFQLTNYSTQAWIGLTDKDKEGKWTYVDGSGEIEYENWEVGEPSSSKVMKKTV